MLLPLAPEPFTAPTDRDLLPSERREFVRTHRTCVFGYRRRNDGPAMSVVYYVPTEDDELLVSTMAGRSKALAVGARPEGEPLRPRRAVAVRLPPGVRRCHRRRRPRARRRRHDGGRRAHARPAARRGRPPRRRGDGRAGTASCCCVPAVLATFAQPPRHLHARTKPNSSRTGSREGSGWNAPDRS